MALPLRENLVAGDAGHIADHNDAHDVVNEAARVNLANVFAQDQKIADGAKLLFGTAGDTNLYRSAADTLHTDDLLVLGPAATDLASFEARAFSTWDSGPGNMKNIKLSDSGGHILGYIGTKGASWNVATLQDSNGAVQLGWGVTGVLLAGPINEFGGPIRLNPRNDVAVGVRVTSAGNIPTFDIVRHSAQSTADLQRWMNEDTVTKLLAVNRDGTLLFGSAQDTNLYRSAADNLKTDDRFTAKGAQPPSGGSVETILRVVANDDTFYGGFGSGGTTPASGAILGPDGNPTLLFQIGRSIFRTAIEFDQTGVLKPHVSTSPGFTIESQNSNHVPIRIKGAASQNENLTWWTNSAGAILTAIDKDGKLLFGAAGAQDTNLYRSAADTLKTDDSLLISSRAAVGTPGHAAGTSAGDITVARTSTTGAVFFGTSGTTYLLADGTNLRMRASSGALVLAPDNTERVAVLPSVDGLTFGSARDTNLYRIAANELATDDSFRQTGAGTFHEFLENGTTDAAAGGVNTGRLYVKDNGSGKTQLIVRFNTGAVQVLATEP